MDSLNIDNFSKTLAFKKFKCLLYKHYPKFSSKKRLKNILTNLI